MKTKNDLFFNGVGFGLICLFGMFFLIASCDKDDNKEPNGNGDKSVRQYDAAAGIGDIVTIIVDDNNNTISFNNKTTGESGVVNFIRITTGLMKGALKVDINNEEYYLLEIPGQMIVTYLPFNSTDEFVVGVVKSNYTIGDHVGTWLFFNYEPDPNDNNYWGKAGMTANGRFDLELWDFSGQTFHTETGSFFMNQDDPSIIYSVPDGSNDTIQETIYILPDKLRVYDSGPQVGIGVGFAEPDQALSIPEVAGTYVAIWNGGYGSFTIEPNGKLIATFYQDGTLYPDIEYNDFRRTNSADAIHFNNTFFFTDHINPNPIQDVYLFMLPGEALFAVYHDPDKGMLSTMALRIDK